MNLKKLTWLWFGLVPFILISLGTQPSFKDMLTIAFHISLPAALIGLFYQKTRIGKRRYIIIGALIGFISTIIMDLLYDPFSPLHAAIYSILYYPSALLFKFWDALMLMIGSETLTQSTLVIMSPIISYTVLGAFIAYVMVKKKEKHRK